VRRWKPISRWQLQPTIFGSMLLSLMILLYSSLLCFNIFAIVNLYLVSKSDVVTMIFDLLLFIWTCYLLWPSGKNLKNYTRTWRRLKRMTAEKVITNATEGPISTA